MVLNDIHITRELLRAVARGELSERALAQIQTQHLESLCPFCRREIRAWLEEQMSSPGPAYLLETFPAVLNRHGPELEARLRESERDFEDLLARPREERLFRIDRARSRFRGPFLAERLIQESRRRTLADPGEALHLAELARAVLHPRLYLNGRHNLALYLTEAGRYEQAAGLVAADTELYRQFPEPWTQLRLTWLQGKIAAGLGEAREAERLFRETRDGFLRQGIGYDAAMSSLDLTLLYLREGRMAEVQRLAEEMVAAFESQEVHREALAALRLFQEAARREEITESVVRDLFTYLASARSDPAASRWNLPT